MLCPAAVPLVQADDVASPPPGLVRHPQHVVRLAAALQPMDENQRGASCWGRLPVAVGEELRSGVDGEEPRLNGNVGRQSRPGPESREQRHQVRVREQGMGNECAHQGGNLRDAERNRKRPWSNFPLTLSAILGIIL